MIEKTMAMKVARTPVKGIENKAIEMLELMAR
jgi:hypothetical protein